MPDDRATWIRHSFQLALVTAGFHLLQFFGAGLLWSVTGSAALAAFGLDSGVSAFAALLLATRIHRSFDTLGDNWRSRGVAVGYLVSSALILFLAVAQLWSRHWYKGIGTMLGIILAAISMLVIPIVVEE
jgi:membrane protease YdiL (CAAX protease family)